MSIKIIQERLDSYQCQTQIDEENALKEITQEIILFSLSRIGFFEKNIFLGGTALRILYNLQRFSEDLDFSLIQADKNFDIVHVLEKLHSELSSFGYDSEIQDRSKVNSTIRRSFLKDNSIGKLLSLSYPIHRRNQRKIKIILEIDTNPPDGVITELKYQEFPFPYSILTADPSSLFSGKINAILTRPYTKGRDWYDLIWYISKKTPINFDLLNNSLNQYDPWKKQNIIVDKNWLQTTLLEKIKNTDWTIAKQDVERFIKPIEKESLNLWSADYFKSLLGKLFNYL